MHWIILAIGIIVGGILRLIYYRKKSKVMNAISFIVPYGFGIAGISWAFGALLSFIAEKIKSRNKNIGKLSFDPYDRE